MLVVPHHYTNQQVINFHINAPKNHQFHHDTTLTLTATSQYLLISQSAMMQFQFSLIQRPGVNIRPYREPIYHHLLFCRRNKYNIGTFWEFYCQMLAAFTCNTFFYKVNSSLCFTLKCCFFSFWVELVMVPLGIRWPWRSMLFFPQMTSQIYHVSYIVYLAMALFAYRICRLQICFSPDSKLQPFCWFIPKRGVDVFLISLFLILAFTCYPHE